MLFAQITLIVNLPSSFLVPMDWIVSKKQVLIVHIARGLKRLSSMKTSSVPRIYYKRIYQDKQLSDFKLKDELWNFKDISAKHAPSNWNNSYHTEKIIYLLKVLIDEISDFSKEEKAIKAS